MPRPLASALLLPPLLLLLLAPPRGAHGLVRTALLMKTHLPTAAMLARFCHLGLERGRSAFGHATPYYLQYYLPDNASEALPHAEWCANRVAEVHTLPPAGLGAAFGEARGAELHRRRWALGSVHELAFHARHRASLDYDFLWVAEQDVAWQGNLFDVLGLFATWPDDLVCDRVTSWRFVPRTGDAFADGDDGWFAVHSGWADRGVANTTHVKCYRYLVRYSRRLLDVLVDDYLRQGHWAQDEWFASTICALQLADFGATPCSVRDYQELPHLFSTRWRCCPKPYNESDWHYSVYNRPLLYHAMKF